MTGPTPYESQHRGDPAAYAQYYAGMDRTMSQKLAFVGAHFLLDPGSRIADMGCGSGSGTHQLALLNPQIQVIGVDINLESIRIAAEKYKLPNLRFMVGDVAQAIFSNDPLDGILSSSTLHHVYTFNDYSANAVRQALASHLACLRENGVFVLRDFVNPAKDSYVVLELGGEESRGPAIAELSEADLLKRFSQTARPLDRRCGAGFFLEEIEPLRPGKRLFRLQHKWAAEFVLRKDYRRDWDVELLEEYAYFTAAEFAEEIVRAGARLLSAEPYWNPWIVKNRFEGRFRIMGEDGRDLGWPPTNFVAVAQRVGVGGGLRLIERRQSERPASFLLPEAMKAVDGTAYDLVRRPHPVCDLLPWRISNGRLRIAARYSYPRPITCIVPRGPTMIDGARWGGYLVEPITGMVPADASSDAIASSLLERAAIDRSGIAGIAPGLSYYPSPGGIDEVVKSIFVAITTPVTSHPLSTVISGFSTAGQVREFDAQDLLRAAHVGVLPEARLEINIYALMKRLGISPDPFLGEANDLGPPIAQAAVPRRSLEDLLGRPPVLPFKSSGQWAGYLRLLCSVFAEQAEEAGLARTLAEQHLEFVLPRNRSINTAVAIPLVLQGEPLVGLETRLLPVPQRHEGNARILVAPAWRLDRDVETLDQARAFIANEFGVGPGDVLPLGAAYFPSAGITPERAHPFVVKLSGLAGNSGHANYDFVSLIELRDRLADIRDGHLLVAASRLLHALGLWEGAAPS